MKAKLLLAFLVLHAFVFNTNAQTCSAIIGVLQNPNSPDVTFRADSIVGVGVNTSFSWSFGDNTTDTGATVTHTYTMGGFVATYNVCLTMTDTPANCNYTTCVTITVPGPAGGNCSAAVSYSNVDSLYTVYANGTGIGALTYAWSVNGQSVGNGASVNLVIDTLNNSNYTEVCVTITDANGCVASNCGYITTANQGGCNTYLTYTNQDSLYTFFTSNIGGTPVAYVWTVGNVTGTTNSSFSMVIDSFPAYVCLLVTDTFGNTCSDCITLAGGGPVGGNPTCQAYFVITSDSLNGLPGYYYGYNYSSGNFANSLLWDFGDGTTSTNPYPTHTYATPGNYIVCLTVGTPGTNCYDTYCDSSFYVFKTEGGQMSHLTIAEPTGVKDLPKTAYRVYPNPVNNELSIESIVRIDLARIINLNGQKVFETKAPNAKINLSKLPAGIYVLELNAGNKVSRTKLVKE